MPELLFEPAQLTLDRREAAQARRLRAAFEVGVEECRYGVDPGLRVPLRWGRRPLRIEPRLHLTDEPALPIARLFHRLDRPLLAWLHPRNRVVVDADAIPRAAPHHVEPQMFQTAAPVLAAAGASSSDRHGSSFTSLLLSVTRLWLARRGGSSRGRRARESGGP
jgi:hypothetical protein